MKWKGHPRYGKKGLTKGVKIAKGPNITEWEGPHPDFLSFWQAFLFGWLEVSPDQETRVSPRVLAPRIYELILEKTLWVWLRFLPEKRKEKKAGPSTQNSPRSHTPPCSRLSILAFQKTTTHSSTPPFGRLRLWNYREKQGSFQRLPSVGCAFKLSHQTRVSPRVGFAFKLSHQTRVYPRVSWSKKNQLFSEKTLWVWLRFLPEKRKKKEAGQRLPNSQHFTEWGRRLQKVSWEKMAPMSRLLG